MGEVRGAARSAPRAGCRKFATYFVRSVDPVGDLRVASTSLCRFSGAVIDALGPEGYRCSLLGRGAVDVRLPGDLEVLKPGLGHDRFKLCFQQSTGDSATP